MVTLYIGGPSLKCTEETPRYLLYLTMPSLRSGFI